MDFKNTLIPNCVSLKEKFFKQEGMVTSRCLVRTQLRPRRESYDTLKIMPAPKIPRFNQSKNTQQRIIVRIKLNQLV